MSLFLNSRERSLLYALPALAEIQIVCGDCSAPPLRWSRSHRPSKTFRVPIKTLTLDERRNDPWPTQPIKTLLTLDGRCHKCGGRNYELASMLAARAALDRIGRLEDELEALYKKESAL